MYNTATREGLQWRVPDIPFIMETRPSAWVTTASYPATVRTPPGQSSPSYCRPATTQPGHGAWRCTDQRCMRSSRHSTSKATCPATTCAYWPTISWTPSGATPSQPKHAPGGTYPYDSDPAGTATHPLVRPFTAEDQTTRGDRAWLAGSLAMSTPAAQAAYLLHAPNHELADAPETDLHKRPSAAIIFRGTFHGLSSLSAGRMCWFSVDLRFQTLPLTVGVLLFTQVKALKDGG